MNQNLKIGDVQKAFILIRAGMSPEEAFKIIEEKKEQDERKKNKSTRQDQKSIDD